MCWKVTIQFDLTEHSTHFLTSVCHSIRVNAYNDEEDGDHFSDEGIDHFIFEDLRFLNSSDPASELYFVDSKDQRGINCRFGMRGLVAENHFDLSRYGRSCLIRRAVAHLHSQKHDQLDFGRAAIYHCTSGPGMETLDCVVCFADSKARL